VSQLVHGSYGRCSRHRQQRYQNFRQKRTGDKLVARSSGQSTTSMCSIFQELPIGATCTLQFLSAFFFFNRSRIGSGSASRNFCASGLPTRATTPL